MSDVHITVIGAGVVGLALASRFSEKHSGIVLLEKNQKHGLETSSRNSEVIHAGIYYKPGSLKALLCVEGRDRLYELCDKRGIAYRKCGKLITATNEQELLKLHSIFSNGRSNGVPLNMLTKDQVLSLEPNIVTVGAIHSPLTGVISVHELMDYFHHNALEHGATVQPRCEVTKIERRGMDYEVTVREDGNISSFTSEIVINAAGLHSDTVAAMAGIDVDAAGYRLVYAKGSYFSVIPAKAGLVSRLVYPVPQNEGIGVHAVLDWGGRLKFGPDVEYLSDRTLDYFVQDKKRASFGESIRKILPQITDDDIAPDMSGIRPKLQRKGEPAKDFVIVHEKERGMEGLINLIGIESPGLTSCIAIARHVEGLLK
jgi:L-2-hydroxyglutarate oxidase LhgO